MAREPQWAPGVQCTALRPTRSGWDCIGVWVGPSSLPDQRTTLLAAGDGLRSFQTEGFTLTWGPELSKQWEKVFGAGLVGLQTKVKYTWCEK